MAIDKHETCFNEGVTLLENKEYTQARDSFQKAIDIEPKFIPAWVYKGMSLEELEQYEEAINCYNQAIRINPDVADLWYNKGATYCKMKRYGDALNCFNKVLEIEPLNALAKTARALVIAQPTTIETSSNKIDEDGDKEGSNSSDAESYTSRYWGLETELGNFDEKEMGQ